MLHLLNDEIDRSGWKNYSLLLPAISVGNIGQLVIDLLISTFGMDKVGYLYDRCFQPVVGNNAFAVNHEKTNLTLTTSCEVFESKLHKIMVIQQRAPFVRGERKRYVDNLIGLIKSCQFKEIIVLGGIHAHERIDQQIAGSQFRYLCTPKCDFLKSTFNDLKWSELEMRPEFPAPPADQSREKQGGNGTEIYVPGGGITKLLYEACCEQSIPMCALLVFCSEGNNVPDAMLLARHLNLLKDFVQHSPHKSPDSAWKIPSSWTLYFGNEITGGLF